jgi:tetratricopeptide (TPR) repeat protein
LTPLLVLSLLLRAETPAAKERFRRCFDTDGEAGIAACRAALGTGLGEAHEGLVSQVLAQKLAELSRWEDVVEVDRGALRSNPQDIGAHLRLGEALLYGLNRPKEAAEVLREAARSRPNDARAFGLLGSALSALGQHAEAVAAFEEASRLDPSYFAARPASQLVFDAARRGESWP